MSTTALAPVPVTTPESVGLLRLSDVAAMGYAAAGTLRRRIREGALPAHRVGNSFRVRLVDVERLYPLQSAADSVDAAVAAAVAAAPPLTPAQIDRVIGAFGDALRAAAVVDGAGAR